MLLFLTLVDPKYTVAMYLNIVVYLYAFFLSASRFLFYFTIEKDL